MNILNRIFRSEILYLGLITVLLIAGAFFLFSITVRGSRSSDNSVWNEYYGPMEDGYVDSVREYMNDNGFVNSGVTLTHTTDEDLNRVYTLNIHHRRLENCGDERREEISAQLRSMGFEDERITIKVNLCDLVFRAG